MMKRSPLETEAAQIKTAEGNKKIGQHSSSFSYAIMSAEVAQKPL